MLIRLHFISFLILSSACMGCLPSLAVPNEPLPTATSSVSTPQPDVPAPGIQQQVADNFTILYAQGNGLHAWPELAIFQQPPFLTLYPGSLGYYGQDLAPRQWGRYLLIPGLKRSPNTSPTANDATTWLVDLQTNEVKEVGHEPLHAIWSPTNTQFVYVKNETVYVADAGHPAGATAVFSEPGLNDFFIAWSPDGTQLAVINHQIGDSSAGEYPQITDTLKIVSASGDAVQTVGTFSIVPIQHSRQALQWSADGRYLALAYEKIGETPLNSSFMMRKQNKSSGREPLRQTLLRRSSGFRKRGPRLVSSCWMTATVPPRFGDWPLQQAKRQRF